MQVMLFEGPNHPLRWTTREIPSPKRGELLLRVTACGVCRTDLHIIDGELSCPKLPLVLGHQVVGYVESIGEQVYGWKIGDRAGLPWLGGACGHCFYCLRQQENLCDEPCFTGFHRDGGYATYCTAFASFAFPLPQVLPDEQLAPFLCAGMIGYRALKLAGDQLSKIGLVGFGASAHLLTQLLVQRAIDVFAFTRSGDLKRQQFALQQGAIWAGSMEQPPSTPLDAMLLFAPVGSLVPTALQLVRKGGSVVCAGIHMSDIPAFSYRDLWEERLLRSVANLTRLDGQEFLEQALAIPLRSQVHLFPLKCANEALAALRAGVEGAVVLRMDS